MSARFTVLASGSSGNAAFLAHRGFGLLVDCGIGPRALSDRLLAAGAKWSDLSAVVLTHTHGDHWNRLTLARMLRERVTLVLHEDHASQLAVHSQEFPALAKAGLVRTFRAREPIAFAPGLTGWPIQVPHDAEPTYAFRFDGADDGGALGWSLGYASDLGRPTDELERAFRDTDVLAIEFNHDVDLQKRSHRPAELIARVLGDFGHLSNSQAWEFVTALHRERTVPLRAVFQLHLSRECNAPELARAAGVAAFRGLPVKPKLVTARQDIPTEPIAIEVRPIGHSIDTQRVAGTVPFQPALPGLV
jgi:phosphoribosyl 1,2-cyclic phosphodiesterase